MKCSWNCTLRNFYWTTWTYAWKVESKLVRNDIFRCCWNYDFHFTYSVRWSCFSFFVCLLLFLSILIWLCRHRATCASSIWSNLYDDSCLLVAFIHFLPKRSPAKREHVAGGETRRRLWMWNVIIVISHFKWFKMILSCCYCVWKGDHRIVLLRLNSITTSFMARITLHVQCTGSPSGHGTESTPAVATHKVPLRTLKWYIFLSSSSSSPSSSHAIASTWFL